jgi:thermitase
MKNLLHLSKKMFSGAVIAGLLSALAQASAAEPEVSLIIKPKSSMPEAALHALVSAHGGRAVSNIPQLNVRIIRLPANASAKALAAISKHKDVEYAEPDFTASALNTANDPQFTSGAQWSLQKIEAPVAWNTTTGSSNVVVAVIDSGVTASHPDLAGKVLPGYDFINNDTDATDDNGHGTAVAGLIGAATNNGIGMAAVSWNSMILPVKALGADGNGSYSAISNAIIWAADRGARIINLSLGGTSASTTLQNAVNYAWNRNCVIIAAAGNSGNDVPQYPGACTNVVAVSATNSSDARASWSNFGTYVDIAAPGVNVLTLQGASSYSNWNGTSFSSPITAGVVALMASANAGLNNATLVNTLLANADDLGTVGYDVNFGHGRVNARRAVQAALGAVIPDTTAPSVSISSPANGSTVAGTVNVNLSSSDNVAVTRTELFINGSLFGSSTTASASFSWDTTAFADGTYSLEARAYDAANNIGTRTISVTVRNTVVADTTAPTVSIISPTNGARLKGRSVNVDVRATDNVAVTRVELFINGSFFGASTSSSPRFVWNIGRIPNGTYTLQSFAYDAAGNIGASSLISVRK